MKEIDLTIAEMYPTMKDYLPRLSSYLMNLYSDKPEKACQKTLHQYASLILFSFCNYFRYDEDLANAYNYAYENLSQEEFVNRNYLSFIDGKLYDKTYSMEYISSLIEDAAICFEIPFAEIQERSPGKMDMFMTYIINTINHIYKNTDINSELYLNEYLEQCFLIALKNNLEIYFEYKDSLTNK